MPDEKLKKVKKPASNHVPERYSVLRQELESLPIRVVYPKLIEKLQVDIKKGGDNALRQLIIETPEDRRMAGYIYAVAREDCQRVSDEYERLMGLWSEKARQEINQLKEEKKWQGQVYPSDVERWVASHVPEWNEAKEKLRKAEMIKEAARSLYDAYENRLGSLQTYARLSDRNRPQGFDERNARQNER